MSEQLIEELTDEIDGLHDALEDATKEERRLREINAELLAALKDARLSLMPNVQGGNIDRVAVQERIDATIARAEES